MPNPIFKRTKSVAERNLKELMDKLGDVEYPPVFVKKTKNIFRFLDQGNTGTVNLEGRKQFADNLQRYAGISDEKVAEMKQFITNWHLDVAKHPSVKVTFDDFLKTQYVMATNEELREDFVAFLQEAYARTFQFLDTDQDGIISRQEWRVFYKCLGIHDETIADASFDTIDLDKNNQLSIEEFIKGSVEFTCTLHSGKYDCLLGPLED